MADIKKRTVQELASMTMDELCELDDQYRKEIERLYADRGSLRNILTSVASEQGMNAVQAVSKYRAKLVADPEVGIKAM
jgi:siroheme synthase (precorrin-2 oxidase/ferrochelatase)